MLWRMVWAGAWRRVPAVVVGAHRGRKGGVCESAAGQVSAKTLRMICEPPDLQSNDPDAEESGQDVMPAMLPQMCLDQGEAASVNELKRSSGDGMTASKHTSPSSGQRFANRAISVESL